MEKLTEVDCSRCSTPCCRSPIRAMLNHMERTSGDYEFEFIYPEYGQSALKQVDGHCVYLDCDSYLCTIYEKRPTVCQQYGCSTDPRITYGMQSRESNPAGSPDEQNLQK